MVTVVEKQQMEFIQIVVRTPSVNMTLEDKYNVFEYFSFEHLLKVSTQKPEALRF